MTRESAVAGTPTYTIFAGRLAGVDAELIRRGLLHDLRDVSSLPDLAKKPVGRVGDPSDAILDTVVETIYAAARADRK
jgi:predicted glycosyltransferase